MSKFNNPFQEDVLNRSPVLKKAYQAYKVGDLPKCERLLGEMVMKYVPATSKLIVEEE
jgi:hypothetical protein